MTYRRRRARGGIGRGSLFPGYFPVVEDNLWTGVSLDNTGLRFVVSSNLITEIDALGTATASMLGPTIVSVEA